MVCCVQVMFSLKPNRKSPASQKLFHKLKADITEIHTVRCPFPLLIPKIILCHEASLITTIKYKALTFIKALSHPAERAILEPALAKGKETLQILPSPASN